MYDGNKTLSAKFKFSPLNKKLVNNQGPSLMRVYI